jgi:peptidoglycan biosynthesis protein MviN/MurJ (putative lipid II flippase)
MAHAGLALAESLSFLLKAVLLLILLPKELRQNEYRKIFQSFGITIVITAGMATVVLLSLAYFQGTFEVSHSFSSTALAFGAAAILGLGSYLVFSLLFQRTEMRDISRLVRAGFTKS